jgi:hypothetical protein
VISTRSPFRASPGGRTLSGDPEVERNPAELKGIAYRSLTAMEAGSLRAFAELREVRCRFDFQGTKVIIQ